MKINQFIFAVFFIFFVISCQSKSQYSREIIFQRIARDTNYVAYQQKIVENAHRVTVGGYDLIGIGKLYEKHPEIGNACGFNKAELQQIKGGILYQKIHCDMLQHAEKLNDKFQFDKLSITELDQIEKLYKLTYGRENLAEKIYREYNNDVKFCKTQGLFSGRCLLEAEAAYAKGVDITCDIFYTCE